MLKNFKELKMIKKFF